MNVHIKDTAKDHGMAHSDEAVRAKYRARCELCKAAGKNGVDQAAFRQLLKQILTADGEDYQIPSDKDLDTLFDLEDEDHVGVIDEEDFVELYRFVRSGEAKDLGKHGSVSSRYEKKRADMRARLHHHTKTHASEESTASARQSFQKKAKDEGQDGKKLDREAFTDLVKKLFIERGGAAIALPSDEDLATLFALEDTNHIGRIDEDDFLELLNACGIGGGERSGQHSSISSRYDKKRGAMRINFTTIRAR